MDSSLCSSRLPSTFKQLKVAVIGGGVGGLAAAVALRRAGHIGSLSLHLTAGGVSDKFILYPSRDLRTQRP